MVRYGGAFAMRNVISGRYEVLALLPERDGDNQYRIRSGHDYHQRVAQETDLHPD